MAPQLPPPVGPRKSQCRKPGSTPRTAPFPKATFGGPEVERRSSNPHSALRNPQSARAARNPAAAKSPAASPASACSSAPARKTSMPASNKVTGDGCGDSGSAAALRSCHLPLATCHISCVREERQQEKKRAQHVLAFRDPGHRLDVGWMQGKQCRHERAAPHRSVICCNTMKSSSVLAMWNPRLTQ